MENKINIAELLKDCPQGMELDCTMYDDVSLIHVLIENNYPIKIETPDGQISLNEYGCYSNNEHAKCVIFPKGKTTWEGFVSPCKFKDGDIVATTNGRYIGITTGGNSESSIPTYCVIKISGEFEAYFGYKEKWMFSRYATEEEKGKIFQAIKNNGYRWNAETKTLEKLIMPKFKVGDRIKDKNNKIWHVTQVSDRHFSISLIPNAEGYFVPIKDQDDWELVPNKFDINTLRPFDKVLVRNDNSCVWKCNLYSHYSEYPYHYVCIDTGYKQCIPYDANKELLGTTNNPE